MSVGLVPQIFYNFMGVKELPESFIVDEVYVATSGDKFRRLDGFITSLKYHDGELDPEDWISRLPDVILVDIISRLSTEEAAKTSVLSTRWETLWWHTSRLAFHGKSRGIKGKRANWHESSRFMDWVKYVMQFNQATNLDEFCVRIDPRSLCLGGDSTINEWVDYALLKRAKKLELDITNSSAFRVWFSNRRTRHKSLTKEYLDGCSGLSCSKEVSLKGLEVSSEVIEFLLLECRCLERLTVMATGRLANVVVSSPSLKYLSITFVDHLIDSIKFWCFPSLETILRLDDDDDEGALIIRDAPMLSELHLYVNLIPSRPINHGFLRLLYRLEALMLPSMDLKHLLKVGDFPELSNLKSLMINMGAWDNKSLIKLITSFIAACPNLQKFTLQLFWVVQSRTEREQVMRINRPLKMKHLKIVEVSGYYGRSCEDEFILHLLENGGAVEKLVLNPRSDTSIVDILPFDDAIETETARICALEFQHMVPSHIEVVIL